ncbi:MAG: hypothetical protein HC902_04665 [Calothrix sp. SM1_5_4]|nr:hypothetical protein [Calothrix sp. SM1_5_4]
MKQMASAYLEQLPSHLRAREGDFLARTTLGDREVVTAKNSNEPGGGLEFSRTLIDDDFDREMRELGAASRAWLRNKLLSGYRVRVERLSARVPVLIELTTERSN